LQATLAALHSNPLLHTVPQLPSPSWNINAPELGVVPLSSRKPPMAVKIIMHNHSYKSMVMHTSLKNTGLQLSVHYEKGMETMGGDLNLSMATFFLTSF